MKQSQIDAAVKRLQAIPGVTKVEAIQLVQVTVTAPRTKARDIYVEEAKIMHDIDGEWDFNLIYEQGETR